MSAIAKLSMAAAALRQVAAELSHVDTEKLSRDEAFMLADLRGASLEHANRLERLSVNVTSRTKSTHDIGLCTTNVKTR